MTFYKTLGLISMILLAVAMSLSGYVLLGKRTRKVTFIVSATVLFLMICISVLCMVIYSEYGRL